MARPPSGKPPAAEQRQALEADCTFRRLVELRLDPVGGRFDAEHLKEIHRRIFQDLPALGFAEVAPGRYRRPVAAGNDWMKSRRLETTEVPSNVAYSPMDKAAVARLVRALQGASPAVLGQLDTAQFVQAIGNLYAELDYVHPFADGNSRTLREFARELAEAAGYTLAWERFATTPGGRDLLYIARDRSVNARALPHLRHASTRRDIVLSMDQFERNRDLPDLLRDAIRPSRAISFEQRPQDEALRAHPDLTEAFETLRAAQQYFKTKLVHDTRAQHDALQSVRTHVQQRLDAGQTRGFRASLAEHRQTPEQTHSGEQDSRDAPDDAARLR